MSWMSKTRVSRPSRSSRLGLLLRPVKADDRQARGLVLAVGHLGVHLAADPVLRAEQADELHAGSLEENVDRRPAIPGTPGLVRHQPHALIAEGRESLVDQDVDAALHLGQGRFRGHEGRRRAQRWAPGCIDDRGGGERRDLRT